MVEFTLSPSSFRLLKEIDLSEMESSVVLDGKTCKVKTSNLWLLQTILNEEIVTKGLTPDQQNVTPYGRELEGLYDEILYVLEYPWRRSE